MDPDRHYVTRSTTSRVAAIHDDAVDAKRGAVSIRPEQCVFYFDLEEASFLPKLTKYVTMIGAVLILCT